MSYATKLYGIAGVAGAFVVAAIVLGLIHLWWFAAALDALAVMSFIIAARIGRSGNESERREVVDAGERAIGAGGRAEGGGWTPRGTNRPSR
jgi:hypothetical protein